MKNSDDHEGSLDDDFWKDSFDRLLNKRSQLRELCIVKNDVRASYNNNSSVRDSITKLTSHIFDADGTNGSYKRKETESTPNERKTVHLPFDCSLSPISSWSLVQFSAEESVKTTPTPKLHILNKENCQQPTSTSTYSLRRYRDCDKIVNSSLLSSDIIPERLNEDKENNTDIVSTNPMQTSADQHVEPNVNVVLPPGKWRKSLTVWKKLNNIKHSRTAASLFRRVDKNYQEQLLNICTQTKILSFTETYSDNILRKCRKIGEGTYGEVFLFSNGSNDTVLKIIPIEGEQLVNGELQKTIKQIFPEVIVTKELSNLRKGKLFQTAGFVHLRNVRYVRGNYPCQLIELWNLYEKHYGSENDHPGIFTEDQLYLIFEIDYSGKDLEKFMFRNYEQAYSVYLQVLFSLAIAEKKLEFEHRDLHCGNILIQETNEKHVKYKLNRKNVTVPTNGVKVTIIDYSLSRIFFEGCCYYNDLSADDDLFHAKGDYQYDIYRLMRTKLRDDWKTFEPKTNIMWMHFLLTKLLSDVKYKNSRSKRNLLFMGHLKTVRDTILNYSSTFEVIDKINIID